MFHCILHIFLHVLPKNFPDKPHALSYYYLKIWSRGVILAFSWLRGGLKLELSVSGAPPLQQAIFGKGTFLVAFLSYHQSCKGVI